MSAITSSIQLSKQNPFYPQTDYYCSFIYAMRCVKKLAAGDKVELLYGAQHEVPIRDIPPSLQKYLIQQGGSQEGTVQFTLDLHKTWRIFERALGIDLTGTPICVVDLINPKDSHDNLPIQGFSFILPKSENKTKEFK